MRTLFLIFTLLYCFCAFPAQAHSDSLLKKDRYIRHNYENDFFTATDRYYTQGVYLELILPVFKKSLLAKTLIPLNKKGLNYYGIGLERQGFTPVSIRHEGLFYGERPYAAVAYITHSLVSINTAKTLRLTTRINWGFIGPNLRGGEEQKGIHYALENIQPLGWENQIENDYVLNYEAFLEKGLLNTKYLEMTGTADLRLGTLYDDIGIGAMIRTGWMQPYFNNLGITKNKDAQKFQCYLYARGKVKAVGYNATMQGGVFNRNSTYTIPADDIERLVGTLYYGVVMAYKGLSVEFALATITPEFRNGLNHAWGRAGIYVCF
ncbi:MAG TPA: lipid A deacylase LpxR family protein [Bacteroidia bacterium]|jgi:hypothetical protein